MEKLYDIFISYRRRDSVEVEHIYDELAKVFDNIFFDQEEIHTGEMFEKKILGALKKSKIFLLVLTKDACKEFEARKDTQDWLVKEISFANANNIPILPVMLYNEEDAKEVNELINKKLKECVPQEIAFLPKKQFFKIRLERKARKGDLILLKEEIVKQIGKTNDIQKIKTTLQEETPKKKDDSQKTNLVKYLVALILLIALAIGGYFYFNTLSPTTPKDINRSFSPKEQKLIECGKKELSSFHWKSNFDKFIMSPEKKTNLDKIIIL